MKHKSIAFFLLLVLAGVGFGIDRAEHPLVSRSAAAPIQVGLLAFTGDAKVDDRSIRQSMAESLKSRGIRTALVSNAQTDGGFNYFVGVELQKAKKGSSYNVIVTLYAKDGQTVAAQVTRSRGGGSDDSIRPMVLEAFNELSGKIK